MGWDTYLDYIIVTNKNLPLMQLLRLDSASSRLVLKLLKDLLKLKNKRPTDKLREVFSSNCCHSIDINLAPYNQMEHIHDQSTHKISSHLFMQTLLNNLQLEIFTHQKYHTKYNHITHLKQKHCLSQLISINPPTSHHNTTRYYL